ncbi:MAG TPA: hypothetical protein VNM16_13090 [Bacillota bacterium]|nr:hypothetical protein [Bacillota bacterium]
MADALRRIGWLLVGCAVLLALTVVFIGAALAAACAACLCFAAAGIAGRRGRRAARSQALPVPSESY